MTSIRRRLLFSLLGLFILGWFVAVAATYVQSRHQIEKLFDAQLERSAKVRVMLWVVANTLDDIEDVKIYEGELARSSRHEKGLAFQVRRRTQEIFHTPESPHFLTPDGPGFSDQVLDGREWRVYTAFQPEESLTVQVGEPYAIRRQLVYEITRNALYPLLLAIPLLAAMIWLGVGGGLRPLKKVSSQVAERSPSHLHSIETKDVPSEIRIFVDELNTLLLRLREAFEMERQFTANAAHEIRTPLASLKTHAQVALRSMDQGQREERLMQIIRGVDRVTHLVEQLLTLARLDYESQEQKFTRIDLASLAREVLAEIAPMALDKGVELSLGEGSRGEVTGNPAGLAILIRNLVDNAIRYAPSGGTVEVDMVTGEDGTSMLVTDDGPGIPPDELPHVFERFYRGSTNDSLGCGLGLSIVNRIVELHNGRIVLNKPLSGRGLQVRIDFPSSIVADDRDS